MLPSSPPLLTAILRDAIEVSFNRISVDGDTSTNDTVLIAWRPARAGRIRRTIQSPVRIALTHVCTSLARQIVADGEGVSHVVELQIRAPPPMLMLSAWPRPSLTRRS